jgi:hypothetical protein
VRKRPEFPEKEKLTQAALLVKSIEADIFNMGGCETKCISLEDVVLIHSNGHREEFSKIYLRPMPGGLGEPHFWEVLTDFSGWLSRDTTDNELPVGDGGEEVASEA